ncbi:transcription factor hamlet isoform X3 [Argonauta hians]
MSAMDGAVYVYPQYRPPVALLGPGSCLDTPGRCAPTGRSICQIPFGTWKLDGARYSFDKHCFSSFCPPTLHRLTSAADAFHRSAASAAAAAAAAAAVNGAVGTRTGAVTSVTNTGGSSGSVLVVGGSGTSCNNGVSSSSNNVSTSSSVPDAPRYNVHGNTSASVAASASAAAAAAAAAVSNFIPTMGHSNHSPPTAPSLLQAAAHQQFLSESKHSALSFTSSLQGAQKLISPSDHFPSMLPVFTDSLTQLNYGRKVFPCPQCRYTTDRRNNLKRHMLTMHQACSKLLECCGILFTTKASLREHAMIFHYHGYTCFYCGRRFCRKALLKRHLSVHNGQKDFVCSVCDYATSHKSNLERHRKVHVRQDGDNKDDHSVVSASSSGLCTASSSTGIGFGATSIDSCGVSGSNVSSSSNNSHYKSNSRNSTSVIVTNSASLSHSNINRSKVSNHDVLVDRPDRSYLTFHNSHSLHNHQADPSDGDDDVSSEDEEVDVN